MALRRQRLSQRRKAVGLTQESLAKRLGVERSTVTRWEAGDTDPLPSIRPDMARVLDVSIDQLADLLTEPGTAEATPCLTTEATPSASAEPPPATLGAESLPPCPPAESPPAEAEVPDTPVPDRIETRSRRFPRFAVAGIFALVIAGEAATGPFRISPSGPLSPATAGASAPAAPVAAPAVPDPATSNDTRPRSTDSPGALPPAPGPAPGVPPAGPAPAAAAPVPAPHTTQATSRSTTAATAKTPAPPRHPAIPAEIYGWARMAELSVGDQRRAHFPAEPPAG
jgi:transcriptional regulator with XRE-family HTH domain